jgi:protein gp37
MGENSKIEWTMHTKNLWWGCVEVHDGCDNCYARVLSNRYNNGDNNLWGKNIPRKETKTWAKDLIKYNRKALVAGEIHRVFVGSMMDIFEKPMKVINHKFNEMDYNTSALRKKLFEEIVPITPNLMYLFLTKRPSNINKYIPESWKKNPPSNVMFGTSPVNQKTADTLIPQLLQVNGQLFLSVEPQLGHIDLSGYLINKKDTKSGNLKNPIHWIIQGGESGHGKRPFNLDWAYSLKKQCQAAGVPYFFKQIDKIQSIPDDLMIREFPEYHTLQTI